MGVRKVSKTKWLCPFNQFKPCDTDCRAFGNTSDGITPLDHSGCACLILDGIHGLGDISDVAESLDGINRTLFDTLGSPETGAALNAIANIGDVVPDMSDVADSIDNLARMMNPNEYKVLVSEIAESAVKAAKEAQVAYEAHVRMCNADDA